MVLKTRFILHDVEPFKTFWEMSVKKEGLLRAGCVPRVLTDKGNTLHEVLGRFSI